MTRNHLSMRKIKELMRLKFECGCSNRAIARSIGVSSSTVSECVRRIKRAQLIWSLPENLTEDQLEGTLYPMAQQTQIRGRQDIDWAFICQAYSIRILVKQPDREVTFHETGLINATHIFEIMTETCPQPLRGDRIQLGEESFTIQHVEIHDPLRLIWTVEVAKP